MDNFLSQEELDKIIEEAKNQARQELKDELVEEIKSKDIFYNWGKTRIINLINQK